MVKYRYNDSGYNLKALIPEGKIVLKKDYSICKLSKYGPTKFANVYF